MKPYSKDMVDLASLEDKFEQGKKLFHQAQFRQALDIFTCILPTFMQNLGPEISVSMLGMMSQCCIFLGDYVNYDFYDDQLLEINNKVELIWWNNLSDSDKENERILEDLLVDDLSEFLVEDYIFEYTMSILIQRKIGIIKKIGYWGETLDTYKYLESIGSDEKLPKIKMEALKSTELIKNKLY